MSDPKFAGIIVYAPIISGEFRWSAFFSLFFTLKMQFRNKITLVVSVG